MDIAGKSNFAHHYERMSKVNGIDGIFLATSEDSKNVELIKEAERLGCGWYAGPELDILERHIRLCERENADAVIRVTCDCPLFNIDISSKFILEFRKEYYDFIYCSNMAMIQGTLTELISLKALMRVHKDYRGAAISVPIRDALENYKILGIPLNHDLVRPEYRLTVDEPSDLELIRAIYDALYKGQPITLYDVYSWLDDNPQIAMINRNAEIKGCNIYGANLMEKPQYSIVRSGKKYIILDDNKHVILPREFFDKIMDIFPELKNEYNMMKKLQ